MFTGQDVVRLLKCELQISAKFLDLAKCLTLSSQDEMSLKCGFCGFLPKSRPSHIVRYVCRARCAKNLELASYLKQVFNRHLIKDHVIILLEEPQNVGCQITRPSAARWGISPSTISLADIAQPTETGYVIRALYIAVRLHFPPYSHAGDDGWSL